MKDSDIVQATTTLTDWIKNTEECKRYEFEKEKLRHFPELKRKIDAYRQRNYEIQCNSNPDTLFEKIDDFEKEFAELQEDPMARDFLSAELALCRMLQKVYLSITEAVDFDMGSDGGGNEW